MVSTSTQLAHLGTRNTSRSEQLRDCVAQTLGVPATQVRITTTKYSGRPPAVLHGRGVADSKPFFVKTFLLDVYPVSPRVPAAWLKAVAEDSTRPVSEQIDAEWKYNHEFCGLGGASFVPATVAKSLVLRSIVWEQVQGMRAEQMLSRSATGAVRRELTNALLEAGAWLKRVHVRSVRGVQTLDLPEITRRLRERAASGVDGSAYLPEAVRFLEGAFGKIPNTNIAAPVAVSHGDFCLANLMWNGSTRKLSVFDFEHSGYRNVCHDLFTMIFSIRLRLLKPMIPRRAIENAEQAFWEGYAPEDRSLITFVNAMAMWQILASFSQRTNGMNQPGWLAKVKRFGYRMFLKDFVVSQRIRIN